MEKKLPVASVRAIRLPSLDAYELQQTGRSNQHIQDPNWNPGFWVRFPWIGLSALLGVLLCSASSVVVLEVSNGQSETEWPQRIPPNVLLNLINNVANTCFTIAIGNGIAIAWWRKVLKGSSIGDLHRTWSFSASISEIVFSLKYFNLVALAAVVTKFTFIDSTLMQKALTFYSEVDITPLPISNIRGYASTDWPNTGTVQNRAGDAGYMKQWTLDTLKLWTGSGGVYPTDSWEGCHNAFCYLNVPGFGFAFDCGAQTSEPLNVMQNLHNDANNEETIFEIKFTTVYLDETPWNSAHLHMNVTWSSRPAWHGGECSPKRVNIPCRLMPHIIEYPAQIEHISNTRAISVGQRKLSKWSKLGDESTVGSNPDGHILNWNTKQQNGFGVGEPIIIKETSDFSMEDPRSKLAGIQLLLQAAVGGRATASLSNDTFSGLEIHEKGRAAQYRPYASASGEPASCGPQYYNPYDGYFNGGIRNEVIFSPGIAALINQIMFGLAIDATREDTYLQPQDFRRNFEGTQYPYAVHYRVHSAYMWGAVAATVCCVALVLPVYWGFWQLGRKVSLNPFEIAHAFRSPVIAQASSAAPNELMRQVGHQEIRYGPVTLDGDSYGRFGVAAPQNVASVPESGLRETLRPALSRGNSGFSGMRH